MPFNRCTQPAAPGGSILHGQARIAREFDELGDVRAELRLELFRRIAHCILTRREAPAHIGQGSSVT